jgi:hypothetical protein
LTGVAVKVTELPGHTDVVVVLMVTAGVAGGYTDMVSELDVADAGEAQAASEVSIQVTMALLASVVEVNVALLVPTSPPFTCHW